jgi:hypothetical protein
MRPLRSPLKGLAIGLRLSAALTAFSPDGSTLISRIVLGRNKVFMVCANARTGELIDSKRVTTSGEIKDNTGALLFPSSFAVVCPWAPE